MTALLPLAAAALLAGVFLRLARTGSLGRASRRAARLVAVGVVLSSAGLHAAPPAFADVGVGLGATPIIPDPVKVGETRTGTLVITNQSTASGADQVPAVQLDEITLIPSCDSVAGPNQFSSCENSAEPDVFRLDPQAFGPPAGSNDACAGKAFTVTEVDPNTGRVEFQPADQVVLAPFDGTTGGPDTCTITYTFHVLRVPTNDAAPNRPGIQTDQLASAIAHSLDNTGLTGGGLVLHA